MSTEPAVFSSISLALSSVSLLLLCMLRGAPTSSMQMSQFTRRRKRRKDRWKNLIGERKDEEKKTLIVAFTFIAADFTWTFTISSLVCLYLLDDGYTLNNSCECMREYNRKKEREKKREKYCVKKCLQPFTVHAVRDKLPNYFTLGDTHCSSMSVEGSSRRVECVTQIKKEKKKKKSRITWAKYNLLLRRVNWNQLTPWYISHACVTVCYCFLSFASSFYLILHLSCEWRK